jgi:hypothetical protein
MSNSVRFPDPDLSDPRVSIWQWLRAKCKLTYGSVLIWLAPLMASFLYEDQWRWIAALCIAIGIGLSHGRWRRLLGLVLWIGIVFCRGHYGTDGTGIVPEPVGLFWAGGFFLTAFADRERSRQTPAEEEWG